jgi:hypothetical protein
MENERMQRRHADRRIAAALQRVRETGSLSRSTAASRKVTLSRVRWMEGPEPSDPRSPNNCRSGHGATAEGENVPNDFLVYLQVLAANLPTSILN